MQSMYVCTNNHNSHRRNVWNLWWSVHRGCPVQQRRGPLWFLSALITLGEWRRWTAKLCRPPGLKSEIKSVVIPNFLRSKSEIFYDYVPLSMMMLHWKRHKFEPTFHTNWTKKPKHSQWLNTCIPWRISWIYSFDFSKCTLSWVVGSRHPTSHSVKSISKKTLTTQHQSSTGTL